MSPITQKLLEQKQLKREREAKQKPCISKRKPKQIYFARKKFKKQKKTKNSKKKNIL